MIIFILVLLGLCFGSFVNALVWRLHQQDMPGKKTKARSKDLSIATGRSMCTYCRHTLAWYDLVPLLSWISVGGNCRYCKQSIGAQYPIVELLTAVMFVVSYALWPYGFDVSGVARLIFWLISVVGLIALFVYDLRWYLLPNRIVFPLIALGALHALLQFALSPSLLLVINVITAVAVAGGIFWVLYKINENWIGGGDVKLGVFLGLVLMTPQLSFVMIFIASLLGCLVSIPLLLLKRHTLKNTQIPFGPYLIAATAITLLSGSAIINWYTSLFLVI